MIEYSTSSDVNWSIKQKDPHAPKALRLIRRLSLHAPRSSANFGVCLLVDFSQGMMTLSFQMRALATSIQGQEIV